MKNTGILNFAKFQALVLLILLLGISTGYGQNWEVTGNPNIDDNLNYIGTNNQADLVFKTNNIEQMRLHKTGLLGLGTDDPQEKLDVNGQIRIRGGNPAAGNILVSDIWGTGTWKDPFTFGLGGDDDWNINMPNMSSAVPGNVGIGTSAPGAKLEVFKKGNGGGTTIIRLGYKDNAVIGQGGGISTSSWDLKAVLGNARRNLEFANPKRTVMTLNDGGNVGVGTKEPQRRMHLRKSDRKGGSTALRLEYSNIGGVVLAGGPSGASGSRKSTWDIKAVVDGNGNTLQISQPNSTVMTFKENGAVGIGVMNPPAAYRLAIDGKVICEEVLVELSQDWPDYVFEADYELFPLEEMEGYISENKHLPGIPSAKEMKSNGLSLGDMQTRIVKKMEEIILYLIEVKKENKELRCELEALKN